MSVEKRRLASAVLAAAALFWGGALLVAGGFSWNELYHSAGVPVAWAAVFAGIAAWESRSENRTGLLLIALGFAGLVTSLQATSQPLLFTIGSFLADVPVVLLVYLLLSYPRGVLRTAPERISFWITAAGGLIGFVSTFFYDPRDLGCVDCPAGLNLGLIARDPQMLNTGLRIGGILYVVGGFMVLAIIALRTVRATQPARRIVWPVAVPALVILVDGIIGRTYFWILQEPQHFPPWFVGIEFATRMLLPFSILFGLLRLRLRRSRLGELIVELGQLRSPDRVRDAVARTLGDATADVAFWSDTSNGYLDSDGRPIVLPGEDNPDRAATFLEHEGGPLAVILHDPALRDDPRLLNAVAAAAGLAVDNERLQAEILAQLEDVRRSRAHIVEAADAERRRVERDLHDGAQQRLVSLAIALRLAEGRARRLDDALTSDLAAASQELDRAIVELRELARGIYPPVLVQEGLVAALQELAERSPIPLRLRSVDERFDQDVETSAYFVASEAVTNAAKHSFASEIRIQVLSEEDGLLMYIDDDGIGGADPTGSGFSGLKDRVEALDGMLSVNSPPGRGTEVVVRIPCASSSRTTQR